MDALVLIGFLFIMFGVALLLNLLEQKYGVNRKEATAPVKKIERSANWISTIGLIAIVVIVMDGVSLNYIGVILFFGVLGMLQTVFEWKYVRNSRKSLVSFTLTIALILSILGLVEIAAWATAIV